MVRFIDDQPVRPRGPGKGRANEAATRRKIAERSSSAFPAESGDDSSRPSNERRSSSRRWPISSATPAPCELCMTRSARSFNAGSAFATATPHSQAERNTWSFSASPASKKRAADRFSGLVAAGRSQRGRSGCFAAAFRVEQIQKSADNPISAATPQTNAPAIVSRSSKTARMWS